MTLCASSAATMRAPTYLPPLNVVYHHLCAFVETRLAAGQWAAGDPIRILDIGCGSGRLMALLSNRLSRRFPGRQIEIHGFDVLDSRVQRADFLGECLAHLASADPAVEWAGRITLLATGAQWPYPDAMFDIAVSNQVLEHVNHPQALFSELGRVLKANGTSAHIFPLRSCLMELHLKLPFAHWFAPGALAEAYIKLCSRIGLGHWKHYKKRPDAVSIGEFARMNRDFLAFETNYLDESTIEVMCKQARLRPSYELTEHLYWNKLRSLLGRELVYDLKAGSALKSLILFKIMKRVSGITLTATKQNSYENRGFHTA